MALTGLQIQKLLPKTNCKECGSNTCLAFAMKLAAKKADLTQCPYASDEAKQVLGAASEPPVKAATFGPDASLRVGEETVLYRHEKTFVNPPLLAVNLNDTDSEASIHASLCGIRDYRLERVGRTLEVDLAAITHNAPDPSAFLALAQRAWTECRRPLILRSADPAVLQTASKLVEGSRSLLCPATPEAAEILQQVASQHGHALAVTASDLDRLVAITAKLKENGFTNLVLQFQTRSLAERFQTNSIARRAALRDNFKPLGYPSLCFVESDYLPANTVEAITEILKYGGICVLPTFDPAQLATLMALRLNVFTDPQKPIQVEPRIYAIGEPKPESPVFVTTNFSLTYFIVSGEIENSGTSGWLVVPECDGMSVLTAWAAGKFNGATIGKFVKENGLEDQVTTRQIIIPGHVAQISGELEEALPGWKVLVGPQDASDIESFVKARLE